jgi:putative transposase
MKTHYTAKELENLPGLQMTERAIRDLADREGWETRKRAGRGGGREYALASLPPETQLHLKKQHLSSLPAVREAAPVPAVVKAAAVPELTSLTRRQIDIMDARVWFMRLIEQRPAGMGIKKCMKDICTGVDAGDQTYLTMAKAANDRQGAERTLKPRTLMRWWSEKWLPSGKNPAALAPQDADAKRVAREDALLGWLKEYKPGARLPLPAQVPSWLPYLLDEYRQPQKPALAQALKAAGRMLPAGMFPPTYDQAVAVMQKIPVTIREKGRLTGAEYKALLGYVSRDASMDDPFTIMQIDGHSLKAYVAHPTTGAHFHPEVCGIICLTTKVLGGWSAGLAESNETVADAVRHCCTINEAKPYGCVPAIIEPDRGAGNMAKVNSDELTGRFSRLGITFLPPEHGGNPQGHGGIERSNQSIWIRAAKTLITYTGKDMDRVVRKRVYIKLEQDLKTVKNEGNLGKVEATSKLLMTWREFLAWLDEWANEYNNTPHSALPKIVDVTGRKRHMTPLECLASRIKQGWQPVTYPENMLPHLFMPHERITVDRRLFTLHGNKYHAYELHHCHQEQLIAAYDIHDARQVWVLDLDERPICKAIWNGHKKEAQPVSVKQQAIRDREDRRLKNLENKALMIRGEAEQPLTIELTPERQAEAEAIFEALEAPKAEVITLNVAYKRPMFGSDNEKYRWLHDNPEHKGEEDDQWLDWYMNTTEYKLMYGSDDELEAYQ